MTHRGKSIRYGEGTRKAWRGASCGSAEAAGAAPWAGPMPRQRRSGAAAGDAAPGVGIAT